MLGGLGKGGWLARLEYPKMGTQNPSGQHHTSLVFSQGTKGPAGKGNWLAATTRPPGVYGPLSKALATVPHWTMCNILCEKYLCYRTERSSNIHQIVPGKPCSEDAGAHHRRWSGSGLCLSSPPAPPPQGERGGPLRKARFRMIWSGSTPCSSAATWWVARS